MVDLRRVRRFVAVALASGLACFSDGQTSVGGSTGDLTASDAGTDSDAGTETETGTGTGTDTSTSTSTSTSTDTSTGTDTATDTDTDGVLPCNGHVELCDRRLDQVALPATHNSHSAREEGFSQLNANHQSGVAAQLDAGVRGLLLDIYLDDGETVLCHGPCALGRTPHAQVLGTLAAFMQSHVREVVVIIYQDDVEPALVEADFIAAGLEDLVWTWDGGPMPTLAEMIAADRRLLVSAEFNGPPPTWYHHAWHVFWDTPYAFANADEFSCELNRGSVDNPLYLVNHWVSEFDLPTQSGAAQVNAFDVLYGRIDLCREESGRMPTLVAVDFFEEGDLFAAVDALNGF